MTRNFDLEKATLIAENLERTFGRLSLSGIAVTDQEFDDANTAAKVARLEVERLSQQPTMKGTTMNCTRCYTGDFFQKMNQAHANIGPLLARVETAAAAEPSAKTAGTTPGPILTLIGELVQEYGPIFGPILITYLFSLLGIPVPPSVLTTALAK